MHGNLVDKRIALIGCGTIGSHLAKMLAQSGAGYGKDSRLTLIDQQKLRAGNIGRHLLGLPNVGRAKAIAVAKMLTAMYPDLDAAGIEDDALRRLSSLDDYDLVIDATGDEGVANALNAHFVKLRRDGKASPPTIFAWLFGNGAAAQALCTTSLADACYRCLRPDHGGPWRFSPLKSGYTVEEVPAQCGEGPFFPYGVATPVTAAALALQLALDWAKGNAAPKLRTQRVVAEVTQQVRDQDPSKSPRCPACGAEH
jgi:molybdopterin/thiamine biosynthesis adenylyltransferase